MPGASSLILCLLAASAPGQDATPPTAGRILVLDNDRTLEGEICREGDYYSIKRAGGQTWLPARNVRCLCDSHEEAYRVLRSRANLNDPDERLRLAHWCHQNKLPAQALEEAAEAVRLRPTHSASRRLRDYLQRLAEAGPAPPVEARRDVDVEPEPPPAVELSSEAHALFVSKVQPILMNACVRCHATEKGGGFRLARSTAPGPAGPRITRQNLHAVLGQIDLSQPQASRLLQNAVTIHADMTQPPLRGPQLVAYQALEDWVRLVAAGPHLKEPAAKAEASASAAEIMSPNTGRETRTGWAVPGKPPNTSPQGDARHRSLDPFDPSIFNRLMRSPVKVGDSKP